MSVLFSNLEKKKNNNNPFSSSYSCIIKIEILFLLVFIFQLKFFKSTLNPFDLYFGFNILMNIL